MSTEDFDVDPDEGLMEGPPEKKTHKTEEDFERDFTLVFEQAIAGSPPIHHSLLSEAIDGFGHFLVRANDPKLETPHRTMMQICLNLARHRLAEVSKCPGCVASAECSKHGKVKDWHTWVVKKQMQMMAERILFCTLCDTNQHFYEKDPGELHCRGCDEHVDARETY